MNIHPNLWGKLGGLRLRSLIWLLLVLFSEHPWVLITVLGVTDVKPHPVDISYPATPDERE